MNLPHLQLAGIVGRPPCHHHLAGTAVGVAELEIKGKPEDSMEEEHWQDIEDWSVPRGAELCAEMLL